MVALATGLSACSTMSSETTVGQSPSISETPTAQAYGPPLPAGAVSEEPGEYPAKEVQTTNLLGSLRPNLQEPSELIPRIYLRGRVIIGVDQSQNLLSYRNSKTGELQGFEVDLAREISLDIFGDPDRVDFRFVESASRAEALENREVDMIIRTMTITRERQEQLEFSTPYLSTDSRLLVAPSSAIEGIEDLPGRTICVTDGSTSLEIARSQAPQSSILRTRSWADCLVALQQNQADAILSDDAILSGIAAQDPYTEIVGDSLASSVYGIAMPQSDALYDSTGLTRQVNSTIARIRNDGSWWQMYNTWFDSYLTTAGPPLAAYREEEEIS
ncbi:glutamate ABC transporter substrate-binding protein [Corynebacterium alimapuense]|nr:glutamate ABC transporter substrate-binding protein [Corynebacterium alimapuense]